MAFFRQAAALAAAVSFLPLSPARGQEASIQSLSVVSVAGGAPSSLPLQVPASSDGLTRAQVEQRINATDSEDALKYLPSLLVRKRYVGDYNHAIVSSRASGTGNSARSAVYADGMLLSNFLGNGVSGLGYAPRWGMVTPEEIERVDVLYGPFSAAYPGNSVGAVIDYVTRLPQHFEAHGKMSLTQQPFSLYGQTSSYRAWQVSSSAGNRAGDWSWWFNMNRTDSQGQPLTFATRSARAGTVGETAPVVTGAQLDRDASGQPMYVLGQGTQYHSVQDHLKIKLAYDFSPTLRAYYQLGWWDNTAQGQSRSYLRTADGQPFTGGAFSLDGRTYGASSGAGAALSGSDLPSTREANTHVMHGLSLKSRTQGFFDWEVAASHYDYLQDLRRQNAASNTPPAALAGGAGTVADGSGTGWRTLALKGIWRPEGQAGRHVLEGGLQREQYHLSLVTRSTSDWIKGAPNALVSAVGGGTVLQSLWLQDTWALASRWKAVLGGRYEQWQAQDGYTRIGSLDNTWTSRRERHFSPKAALSWQWTPDTILKAALGRAVRMPTVSELYGATSTTHSRYINDPNLRPEKSWTGELSAEKDLGLSTARLTLFAERTRDGLFSQSTTDPAVNGTLTRVQNVGRIDTRGQEFVFTGQEVLLRGLDLSASVTHTQSYIRENAGFVQTPGDTVGKWQPNIARWRASASASYRWSPALSTTLGARYSGKQYRTLNNSDINGHTYMGVSEFLVMDARLRYRLQRHGVLALGIDNLGNRRYWNFHPYPQRSYMLEWKVDL